MQPCAAHSGGYRRGICGKRVMDALKGRWMLDQWVWQRGEEMSFKKLSLVLAAFLLIGLFLVITASHYIGLLRGEAIVVRGTLQGVSWDGIGRRGVIMAWNCM